MLELLSRPFSPVYCDAPEPWQIGFQDPASPIAEGIQNLHNEIFFYLIVIFVGVAWVLGSIVVNYSQNKSPIVYKYANHGFKGVSLIIIFAVLCLVEKPYTGYMCMSTLPVLFSNPNGKSVVGIQGQSDDIKLEAISVKMTPKLKQAIASVTDVLSSLKATEDHTVYKWLTQREDIQRLLEGKLPNPTIWVKDGDLVVQECRKGKKPQADNKAGVYFFFDPEGNESYVGSALSLLYRFTQHHAYGSKHSRYVANNLPVPKQAKGKFYSYIANISNHAFGMYWGVFWSMTPLADAFLADNRGYALTAEQVEALNKLTSFIIRFQEHAFMTLVNPSLNTDPVKFKFNWAESFDDGKNPKRYHVINAATGKPITPITSKRGLTRQTGKTYNQVFDYLDHESSFYCSMLDCDVLIRTIGNNGPFKTGVVQSITVTTEPIKDFDTSSLPNGQLYLIDSDKKPTNFSYSSAKDAAWQIDGKSEHQYIKRYINVERMVETSIGSFYFVQNLNETPTYNSPFSPGSSSKPHAGTAGKRSVIVIYDMVLNVYVEFKSKNQLGMFLWNKPTTGGGTLDRYLHNNVVYKNRLKFYYKTTAPNGVTIIPTDKYFKLLGSRQFPK